MSRFPRNYMKTYRKRAGLTQRGLALLLGCCEEKRITRIERSLRKPDLEIALACQVVFGVLPHELLPGAYALVEQEVNFRAHRLIEMLEARKVTPSIECKLQTLYGILHHLRDAR